MHAPAPGDSRAPGQVGEGPVSVGKERAGGHARRLAFCFPRDGAAPWRPGPAGEEARGEGAAPGGPVPRAGARSRPRGVRFLREL